MAPPSIYPETGRRFKWIKGPLGPQNSLVVCSFEELKWLLAQSIHRNKWVLGELFESSRLEAEGDLELLRG